VRCPQSGRSAISESVIGVTTKQRIRTRTISSFWTMHPWPFWPRLKCVLFHPGSPDNEESRFDHWRKTVEASTDQVTPSVEEVDVMGDDAHECAAPPELTSADPVILRTALIRESIGRRRAECRANMQTKVARLAVDLLVREPDIEGFFGALSKTM